MVERTAMQTYSAEARQAVPVADLGGPNLSQNSQGVPLTTAINPVAIPDNRQSDATMKALLGLGASALAPLVQEEAQRQFMVGVGKAMEGQALKEIVDEQPWYTQIFAPSNAATGARMYTKQAQVAKFVGDVQAKMPELVKQGSGEVQKYAYSALKGLMTGDAIADGIITQEVTEKFGPLFAQHAKGHYEHVQNEAYGAQQGAWGSLGKNFNEQAKAVVKDPMAQPALDAQFGNLLRDLSPFPGQPEDSYEKGMTEFLVGQAAAGNYHTIKRLRALGVVDGIKDGTRKATVERAINAGAQGAVAAAVPELAQDMAANYFNLSQDAPGFLAARAALNAKAAALTGVDDAKIYADAATDNDLIAWMGRKQSAQGKIDTEAHAAANAQVLDALAEAALDNGNAKQLISDGVLKAETVSRAASRKMLTALSKGPVEIAKVLGSSTDYEMQSANTYFSNALNTREYNSNYGAAAEAVHLLQGKARGAVAKYISPDEMTKLEAYNTLIARDASGKPTMEPSVAYQIANNPIARAASSRLPVEVTGRNEAIRAAVKDKYTSWIFPNSVDKASLKMAERVTSGSMNALGSNTDDETAAAYALERAVSTSGLQQVGKRLLVAANPRDKPLHSLIGFGEGDTAAAFDSVMDEIAKGVGASEFDDYQLIRLPDRDGRAQVHLDAYVDGKRVNTIITSDRLKDRATAQFKEKHAPKPVTTPKPTGLSAFGAPIDVRPGGVQN